MDNEREITEPITNPIEITVYTSATLWPTFNDFWNLYDYKKSRPAALRAWNKIKHDEKVKLMGVVVDYLRSTPDKKYRKHPSTWLNQECWNDEITIKDETGGQISEAAKEEVLRACGLI